MNQIRNYFPYFVLILISIFFFHKYVFFGLIPFPGDLLAAEYQPFRSYSYNGYVPGSVPNKAQYFDSIREFYPWRTFTTEELKKGRLPLWNPHDFSGSPHIGNFLTAVFYPFNLLYLATNQVDAWAILVVIQPLLASFFTFMYARKIGLQTKSAILAAVAFGYSSYMNTWLQFQVIGHTLLWLPLILYSIESLIEKINARIYVLLVVSIVCAIFAGHPLDLAVVLLFSFAYLLFRLRGEQLNLKKGLLITSTFFVAILLGTVQLIPTVKLFIHSTRAPIDYQFLIDNILIQPFQLIMFLVPDYFGNPATRNYWPTNSYVGHTLSIGVTSIFFILLSWVFLKKMGKFKKYAIFFTISTAIVLLFVTNNLFSAFFYSINIPIVSTIQPNKLLPILAFCLSLLAGIGMDLYLDAKKIPARTVLYIFGALTIMFGLALLGLAYIPLESRTFAIKQVILSFGIAAAGSVFFSSSLLLKNWKNYAAFGLILLLLAEQYYAFQKFNPFSPREFIFPEAPVLTYLQQNAGIHRFWGYGTARIESNIATQYGLYSPDGFGALNIKRYNEFIRTSKDGQVPKTFNQVSRSVAEIEPGYGETNLPNNQFRLRVLDTLGVKYVLDRVENPKNNETFPASRFKLVWEDQAGWKVYENLLSAPRFFLTNKIESYSTRDEFESKFFAESFDPRSMALVENDYKPSQLCSDEALMNSKISLEKYEPTTVTFTTESTCPAFLFLSDTFDPGWQASINDQPTQIFRTNYALRGIEVPQGVNKIEFNYFMF